MFQLKLADNYQEIIEDIPYFKTKEELPKEIIAWIKSKSNQFMIYQYKEKKYYCAKCLKPLDNEFFCANCQIKHDVSFLDLAKYDIDGLDTFKGLYITDEIKNAYFRYFSFDCYYYFFDVVDNQVFLYLLKEEVYYDNPSMIKVEKHSEITIQKVYFITKDGLRELITQQFHSFNECEYSVELKFFEDDLSKEEYKKYNNLENMLTNGNVSYFYKDNLEKLKTTIYRYSHLWKYGNYLNQQNNFIYLAQLTLFPVFYESFEYLLNYKLYQLAFNSANYFKKKGTFKEMFGLEKMFLPFMQKLDISYSLLNALVIYPKEDLKMLIFIEQNPYITRNLKEEFHLNLAKVKKYFDTHNYTVDDLDEYRDYLDMAKRLELDLTSSSVIFPKDLHQEHSRLYRQLELKVDPEIENKIKNVAKRAMVNAYEDDIYKIFPARSLDDLLDESNQMSNCVRLYIEKIANLECIIYFLRKKDDLSKSFVTIEIQGSKIIQAREKFNSLPKDEVKKFLKQWEKTIIPIKKL